MTLRKISISTSAIELAQRDQSIKDFSRQMWGENSQYYADLKDPTSNINNNGEMARIDKSEEIEKSKGPWKKGKKTVEWDDIPKGMQKQIAQLEKRKQDYLDGGHKDIASKVQNDIDKLEAPFSKSRTPGAKDKMPRKTKASENRIEELKKQREAMQSQMKKENWYDKTRDGKPYEPKIKLDKINQEIKELIQSRPKTKTAPLKLPQESKGAESYYASKRSGEYTGD